MAQIIITPSPSTLKAPANAFQDEPTTARSKSTTCDCYITRVRVYVTLKQACSMEYQGAQDAFKDSMIH